MSSKAQTREKDYERGIRIADRRKAIGLSQDELAHRVGIGRQALSAIENGGDFKTQTLDNLAIVLGVSVDFIMYGKNEENSELLSEASVGIECDQTVVDDGASTSVDRPQMRQLMEILEISDYKVLVVEDIYEITRNPEDLKSMMDRINDLGVTIFDLGTMSARYNNYAIEC